MVAPTTVGPAARARTPRLVFVGPALSGHEGWVITQGEVLHGLFARDGCSSRITSSQVSRPRRAADTVACLGRWRRDLDLAVVSVYSGPAFRMAELSVRTLAALRLPMVLTLRGGNLPELMRADPTRVRRLFRHAAAIVAPSTYLAEQARALGVGCRIIDNVVDLDDYTYHAPRPDPTRLLWMRSFHEIYNPQLAIEVLAQIHASHPDVTLVMGGQDRGLQAEVRELAARRGVAGALDLRGYLDRPTKLAAFADCDIFLNTNRIDNTPVGVLEAAACGLPVVATAVGGVPHLLDDGETALLVGPEDADAMVAAVLRLLEDPELAQRLSRGGRALAERCSWPSVRAGWEALFADLHAEGIW
jgi:glycosyltransferase involved in cell wall biosynthesis